MSKEEQLDKKAWGAGYKAGWRARGDNQKKTRRSISGSCLQSTEVDKPIIAQNDYNLVYAPQGIGKINLDDWKWLRRIDGNDSNTLEYYEQLAHKNKALIINVYGEYAYNIYIREKEITPNNN